MNKFDSLRPKNLYDDVLAQRKLDGTEFFRLYADKFVDVRCLACNADGSFEFHKWGFSHKRCQNCSTLYVSPRPKEDLLISYYNDFKSPNMWTRLLLSADTERKKLQYQPRAELILSLTKLDKNKNAVIVDVGAGSGAFCLAMKSTGMFNKVVALDIADEALEACEKNGLDTIKGMMSDAETSSADLITVNDLIEHLFNPKEFLIDSLRVLKAGGYISIATPNGEGFDFKILKEKTKNITPPEHINYFNPKSIELLLKASGFVDIQVITPGILDVDIIKKEVQNGFNLSVHNEWLDYLYQESDEVLENFQKFLSGNKLSSHMLAVARKPISKE